MWRFQQNDVCYEVANVVLLLSSRFHPIGRTDFSLNFVFFAFFRGLRGAEPLRFLYRMRGFGEISRFVKKKFGFTKVIKKLIERGGKVSVKIGRFFISQFSPRILRVDVRSFF